MHYAINLIAVYLWLKINKIQLDGGLQDFVIAFCYQFAFKCLNGVKTNLPLSWKLLDSSKTSVSIHAPLALFIYVYLQALKKIGSDFNLS